MAENGLLTLTMERLVQGLSSRSNDPQQQVGLETSGSTSEPPNHVVVVLLQDDRDRSELGWISPPLVTVIRDELARTGMDRAHRDTNIIDVWLETSGGDADAAYKVVSLLRSYAATIRLIIPDRAKSAGTLIALGADEIYMAPAAELGPLDVQVFHEPLGMRVSALDISNALSNLATEALALIGTGGQQMLAVTGLSRDKTLASLTAFAAEFIKPVVSQLDPTLLHRARSQLRVAEDYGVRLLDMRGAGDPQLSRHLVHAYPSHSFHISAGEAANLGLPVSDCDQYDLWPVVMEMYHEFSHTSDSIIGAIVPNHEAEEEAALEAPGEGPRVDDGQTTTTMADRTGEGSPPVGNDGGPPDAADQLE